MGVSFHEVMTGDLLDRWGRSRFASFRIKAESTSARDFAMTGRAKITGVVQASPWVDRAPLEGHIRIRPFVGRTIDYAFDFADDEAVPYRFVGQKKLSWRRPLGSATQLFGRIEREGATLAEGELWFDSNALVSFLTSWSPATSLRTVSLHRPGDTDDLQVMLTASQRALFEALVGAVLVEHGRVPAPDDRTVRDGLKQLLALPPEHLRAYRAALGAFEALVWSKTRRRFGDLAPAERSALVQGMVEADRDAPAKLLSSTNLLTFLGMPMKVAQFGNLEYLDSIGHPRQSRLQAEAPPRSFSRIVDAESLESETDIHAEVVVIGTGAGGAALAAELARKGVAVAMIEEGRMVRRHEFNGPPIERLQAMYRSNGLTGSLGTPISIPVGRGVGGTTTINSGTCFGTPEHVLDEWRHRLGFPSDFELANFGPLCDRVKAFLEVAPADMKAVGAMGDVIGRGADAMGLAHGPLPRNAPGCPGTGECVLGCREGAKRSADVSWVPAALAAGAELYTGLPVTRLLMDNQRVVAVEARGNDRYGAPKRLRVHAEQVVVACGSLYTPVFLQSNGFTNPAIGRNLSVHPAIGLVARMQDELASWGAIPQGYALHALQDEGIRYEGFYLPPSILALQLPWVGERLAEWMDDFSRLGQFGFMVKDESVGRVYRGPTGKPVISYRVTDDVQRKLKKGSALLAELFLESGASEVFVPMANNPIVSTKVQARALAHVPTSFSDFRLLGAHPLGSCAMGDSPARAVVDFDHRVYGTKNLHVVDGSVVPTSLGVNPQITIMAMALRAAEIIARKVA